MSRSIVSLPTEQLTPFALDAFIAQAEVLNEQNRQTFTTPFPKASSGWLSHYEFTPYPIVFTSQGDVDGSLSWLVGATLDLSFTRALCAPHYGARGGSCYDPASLVFLEVAAKVDQYTDYAQFCRDLHDSDKGRRYRQLAGLHGAIAGEDDLCHFRYRMGEALIDQLPADRFPVAPDHHQVAAVAVLSLQAVGDHVEGPLIEQDEQPVGCAPGQGGFGRTPRRRQLGRIDPGDPDLAVAQLERVAIDHAGRLTPGTAWRERGRHTLRCGERANRPDQRRVKQCADEQQKRREP